MSQVSKVLRDAEDNRLMFWCPGCDQAHAIKYGVGEGPRWGYNGNPDKPTFTPSILVSGTKFTEKGEQEYALWKNAGHPLLEEGRKFDSKPTVCHSFVTDGNIQFLGDCTHALANQTVPLPDWPLDGDDDEQD